MWINSISLTSLRKGAPFHYRVIDDPRFGDQLIADNNANLQLQTSYRNENERVTPKLIDKCAVNRKLLYNRLWVRKDGWYFRVICAD